MYIKKKITAENIAAILFFAFIIIYPINSSAYKMENVANFFCTVIFALSLCLTWGYCGVFSFGQSVFYALGAYGYSILTVTGANTVVSLLLAVAISGVAGLLLGLFVFYGRIGSMFIGIITMCLAIIMETFMIQSTYYKILGVKLGGYNGINHVSHIILGTVKLTGLGEYIFVAAILLSLYIFLRWLEKSRPGYTMKSVRENASRSELFGYDIAKIQTIAFGAGCAIAGLAGALYSSVMQYCNSSMFGVATGTIVLVMVAAGGRSNPTAVMTITLIYTWFAQYLATLGNKYSNIILGLLVIVIMLLLPNGILATLFKFLDTRILTPLLWSKKEQSV